jgi:hypothetical protein
MNENDAFRGLLASLPTYLQRDGDLVCTTCGAIVGGNSGDQIRHTTWHTMLAALLPPDSRHVSTGGSTEERPSEG